MFWLGGDPFAMLEGLDHPAPGLSQAPNRPAIDLDALYGPSHNPIQAAPQISSQNEDPFGLGALNAPSITQSYSSAAPAWPAGWGSSKLWVCLVIGFSRFLITLLPLYPTHPHQISLQQYELSSRHGLGPYRTACICNARIGWW